MLEDAAAPPGLLEAAAPPPLIPPLLDAAPPEVLAPPAPELAVPPVAELPVSVELAAPPGELGAVLAEDEDEPPGITIVSFSFVVVVDEEAEPLGVAVPPGTTVVVSLRSHAERANAPNKIKRYLLRFMSTLVSPLTFVAKCNTGLASGVPSMSQSCDAVRVTVGRLRSPGS